MGLLLNALISIIAGGDSDSSGGNARDPYPSAVTRRSTERTTLPDGRKQITTTVRGNGWKQTGSATERTPGDWK
jgi:hypothetical protein